MDQERRDEIERDIRRLVEASDLSAATTAALRGYGPEVFRFLLAIHGSEVPASDVFALFTEGVWRGLGRFDWACSANSATGASSPSVTTRPPPPPASPPAPKQTVRVNTPSSTRAPALRRAHARP